MGFRRENMLITYKLLVDVIFILLLAFVLAMLAEGALPGLVASHIGLSKIAIAIILIAFFISAISKTAQISKAGKIQKKVLWPIIAISGLLLFISLFKLDIYLNISILILISTSGYLMMKVLEE